MDARWTAAPVGWQQVHPLAVGSGNHEPVDMRGAPPREHLAEDVDLCAGRRDVIEHKDSLPLDGVSVRESHGTDAARELHPTWLAICRSPTGKSL